MLRAIAAIVGLLMALPAQATVIGFSTRAYSGGALASAGDYLSTVTALMAQAPGAGYGDTTLALFDAVNNSSAFGGGNSNIASMSTFSFAVSAPGTYGFRFGPDFGWGGAVFLDGQSLAWSSANMWWGGVYGAGQSFTVSSGLAAGTHTVQVAGLEDCCDGAMQAQFQANGGAWTTFSATDGLAAPAVATSGQAIPEPASLGLLAGALAGLAALPRRLIRRGAVH